MSVGWAGCGTPPPTSGGRRQVWTCGVGHVERAQGWTVAPFLRRATLVIWVPRLLLESAYWPNPKRGNFGYLKDLGV